MVATSLLTHLLALFFTLGQATDSTCSQVATDNVLMQLKTQKLVSSAVLGQDAWCCSACPDHAYCSPKSGNCYDEQSKSYYEDCVGDHDCCSECAGHAYCSPKSGTCYEERSKSYYKDCAGGHDGGLAPGPAPGGLAPAPAPAGDCCSTCGAYCSPVSGSCYDSKNKAYYLSCNGEDDSKYASLVWTDEFDDVMGDGTVNSSKWQYLNGDNPNNQELQYYTDRAANSHIENGVLKIIAKCEGYGRFHYTSARLATKNIADWGPGHRVEVRAKVPGAKGTWPAIWMLPTDNVYGRWPRSGEIDIMESVGCTAGSVYGTVHTEAYNHMINTQKGQKYYTKYTEWHTYTIDWESSYIHFYVDGQHYNTFAPDTGSSARWPFDQRFYLILNVAVGGSWGGFCLNGGPSCHVDEFGTPQVMEVDYVRIYSSDSGATSAPVTTTEPAPVVTTAPVVPTPPAVTTTPGHPARPRGDVRIKLTAFNVYYAALGRRDRRNGIGDAIARLSADIAVITEQWNEKPDILARARAVSGRNYKFCNSGPQEKFWDGDILYDEDLWMVLKDGVHDWGANRGLSWALLQHRERGHRLLVYGAHPVCCGNERIHLQNALEFAAHVQRTHPEWKEVPVVYMGDFNALEDWQSTRLYTTGYAHAEGRDWRLPMKFIDTFRAAPGNRGRDATTHNSGARLDYVFAEVRNPPAFRTLSASIWRQAPGGSDHYPISAEVLLKR